MEAELAAELVLLKGIGGVVPVLLLGGLDGGPGMEIFSLSTLGQTIKKILMPQLARYSSALKERHGRGCWYR